MATKQKPYQQLNAVELGKALKRRLIHGLPYSAIAAEFGVSKSAVYQRLKPFENLLKDPEAVQSYVKNKSQILDAAEFRVLQQMLDDGTLKKASANNLAYVLQQLFKENHLVKGESTSNIAIANISDDEREELLACSDEMTRGALERQRRANRAKLEGKQAESDR